MGDLKLWRQFQTYDVIIRQHPDIQWIDIDIKQLVHWPYVAIEFFTPEFSFKRKNVFEYNRYIHFTNVPLTYEKSEFIDQVEIINPAKGRSCFTWKMLRCYVNEYLSILKQIKDNDVEVSTVEIILNEFLTDVKEIGMNDTMATNTAVTFNIGKCAYLRNKKISKSYSKTGCNTAIGYCEIITPKVETSLNFFKAVQDMNTPDVSFSYLNIIKNSLKTNEAAVNPIRPLLIYRCTYCQLSFKNEIETMKHIQYVHKMDPNVLCIKCKKSFAMNYLTNIRWKHVCSSST